MIGGSFRNNLRSAAEATQLVADIYGEQTLSLLGLRFIRLLTSSQYDISNIIYINIYCTSVYILIIPNC
jgi:GTP cyclohydrolase II